MSYKVFTARRRMDDLISALYEPVFYDSMDWILANNEWQSYVDAVNSKTVSFQSINEFLTHPDGLAISELGLFQKCIKVIAGSPGKVASQARELLKKLEELGMEDAPFTAEPLAEHGNNQFSTGGHNITSSRRGTSQTYLLRRIARDEPKMLDQIGEGKPYKSVRAAAVSLGYVKPVVQFSHASKPGKVAENVVESCGVDFATELAIELANACAARNC